MDWMFQLYSARNTDIGDALKIISSAGYTQVEAYGESFVDADAFMELLKSNGLSVPSMHINLGPLRDASDAMLARAKQFATSHIVCPYLAPEERPDSTAGWKALAQELSALAKPWIDNGRTFAWHNHDFEFEALADGTVPMQVILDEAPDIQWEIDVAWIARAAADPMPWIKKYGSRISAVHLKDIAPVGECVDEDGWADFGHGTVDWKALMPALLKTGATHYAVEHDNPNDLERFAKRSIASARQFA